MNQIPQFVFPLDTDHPFLMSNAGMTLRDLFAAMAMHALISAPKSINGKTDVNGTEYASLAYNIADCMLKEREK